MGVCRTIEASLQESWSCIFIRQTIQRASKKIDFSGAIGHVRYSTLGKSNLENAQPLKIKDLCIAHNGTIANAEELSGMVGGCTFTPQTMSDTLVAAQRLLSTFR